RRPGSKGTEWLLIKKKDDAVVPGFDIDKYDTSVLTGRTMKQISGDKDSAEWTTSRPATGGKLKASWLADAVARADRKKKASTAERAENTEKTVKTVKKSGEESPARPPSISKTKRSPKSSATSANSAVQKVGGAIEKPMPKIVHPMLATSVDDPFDNPDWL